MFTVTMYGDEKHTWLKLIGHMIEGGSWRQRIRRSFGEELGRCQSARA